MQQVDAITDPDPCTPQKTPADVFAEAYPSGKSGTSAVAVIDNVDDPKYNVTVVNNNTPDANGDIVITKQTTTTPKSSNDDNNSVSFDAASSDEDDDDIQFKKKIDIVPMPVVVTTPDPDKKDPVNQVEHKMRKAVLVTDGKYIIRNLYDLPFREINTNPHYIMQYARDDFLQSAFNYLKTEKIIQLIDWQGNSRTWFNWPEAHINRPVITPKDSLRYATVVSNAKDRSCYCTCLTIKECTHTNMATLFSNDSLYYTGLLDELTNAHIKKKIQLESYHVLHIYDPKVDGAVLGCKMATDIHVGGYWWRSQNNIVCYPDVTGKDAGSYYMHEDLFPELYTAQRTAYKNLIVEVVMRQSLIGQDLVMVKITQQNGGVKAKVPPGIRGVYLYTSFDELQLLKSYALARVPSDLIPDATRECNKAFKTSVSPQTITSGSKHYAFTDYDDIKHKLQSRFELHGHICATCKLYYFHAHRNKDMRVGKDYNLRPTDIVGNSAHGKCPNTKCKDYVVDTSTLFYIPSEELQAQSKEWIEKYIAEISIPDQPALKADLKSDVVVVEPIVQLHSCLVRSQYLEKIDYPTGTTLYITAEDGVRTHHIVLRADTIADIKATEIVERFTVESTISYRIEALKPVDVIIPSAILNACITKATTIGYSSVVRPVSTVISDISRTLRTNVRYHFSTTEIYSILCHIVRLARVEKTTVEIISNSDSAAVLNAQNEGRTYDINMTFFERCAKLGVIAAIFTMRPESTKETNETKRTYTYGCREFSIFLCEYLSSAGRIVPWIGNLIANITLVRSLTSSH